METSPFIVVSSREELDSESRLIVDQAEQVSRGAYAPYSRFQVGSAILLEDGTIISGSNQENAAHPAGMCAERVALYTAASHHPQAFIRKIAVVARHWNGHQLVPVTPCGQCRQVLLEFEERQQRPIEVIMQTHDYQWVKAPSSASLLPFAFTSAALERR
jgi:cytidine deaminase